MKKSKFTMLIAQHRWWYPTAMSGADLANHEFAVRLSNRGGRIFVHGILPPEESKRVQTRKYQTGSIDVSLVKSDFIKSLRTRIEEVKPDVVLTTCPEPNCGTGDITRMVETVSNFDIPVILYVHDLKATIPLFDEVRKQLAAVITNSYFTAKRVKEIWNIECEVVYPIPDAFSMKAQENTGRFITFFNPAPHKGLGVAHALAMNRFPDRPFLFVEGFIDPEQHGIFLSRSGNLVHARRSPDVAAIYSMSRLVIVPSQWEEPFGRVALEAMMSDVPVISSKIGGLLESVGEGGVLIDDYSNLDKWVEAVTLLDNEKERRRLISAGRHHAKKFSGEKEADKFLDIILKAI